MAAFSRPGFSLVCGTRSFLRFPHRKRRDDIRVDRREKKAHRQDTWAGRREGVGMIRLYQFAWSPYCLVQKRLLEYSGVPFRLEKVSLTDRSKIWRLTRERYYQVPLVQDGRRVIFETHPDSQVIAKYLDSRLSLGLFPREWDGVQDLLWRYFENDIEGVAFRLNDIHWREFVPAAERCGFVRHKERRFGRGCLEEWRGQEAALLAQLDNLLVPAEQMVATRPFLLGERPYFVDFSLYGMLANFLFTGHYELPSRHAHLREWYSRIRVASHSKRA